MSRQSFVETMACHVCRARDPRVLATQPYRSFSMTTASLSTLRFRTRTSAIHRGCLGPEPRRTDKKKAYFLISPRDIDDDQHAHDAAQFGAWTARRSGASLLVISSPTRALAH